MCLCGGLGEVAAAGVIIVAAKKVMCKHKLNPLPTLAEMIGKLRTGVRPGQIHTDKRRKARVNEKVDVRSEGRE